MPRVDFYNSHRSFVERNARVHDQCFSRVSRRRSTSSCSAYNIARNEFISLEIGILDRS